MTNYSLLSLVVGKDLISLRPIYVQFYADEKYLDVNPHL